VKSELYCDVLYGFLFTIIKTAGLYQNSTS